jgi:shikimate dehydrogenase
VPEPFAEVIGDPIAHSKSPLIHGLWLDALGLSGAFHRTRVTADALPDWFASRRTDPAWRGCNVTIPHKQAVMPHLHEVDAGARAVGAVNCILPRNGRLHGLNTDVDGVAAALAGAEIADQTAAIIGGGGGARAAIHHLAGQGAAEIRVLVRNPSGAMALAELGPVKILPLDAGAFDGAAVIVNASPLGMERMAPMPPALLAALSRAAPGAVALDMVYSPVDTPFLAAASAASLRAVDGLVMLVGQAKRAFALFFGAEPPAARDPELRALLLRNQPG